MMSRVTGSTASTDTAEWHRQQDEVTSQHVTESLDDAMNREPIFRLWYWAGYEHFFNAHLQEIISRFTRAAEIRILDLGCGAGDLTARLGMLFPAAEVIGIDPNGPSIERARSRPLPSNVTFEEAGFEGATARGPFDVIVCSEVYEHVADPHALLAAIHDSLAPGGYLSLSTPSGWLWWKPSPLNIYRFLGDPRFYWRSRMRPEKHWQEALPHHPASRPAVVARKLEAAGLQVQMQTSSIWHLEDEYGVVYPTLSRWAARRPSLAGRTFFSLYGLLESLLNVLPVLRIFESRRIYWARRLDASPRRASSSP